MNSNQISSELCTNGCGFFGSPEANGMCSKCHKDTLSAQRRESESVTAAVPPPPPVVVAEAETIEVNSEPSVPAPVEATPPAPATVDTNTPPVPPPAPERTQKNRKRCFECRKKVGLTGIECRCKFVFCGMHRYPDQHQCDFDFKKADRAVLERQNQAVVAAKLEKV